MDTSPALNVRFTKYKFIALYVVSIILIGIIITAILDPLVPKKTSVATSDNLIEEDKLLSNSVKTLEANLQELYNLDQQYALEKNVAKVAAIEPKIKSAEQALQRGIDSLAKENSGLSGRLTTAPLSSITSSYSNALNLHKLLHNTRINTISSDNNEALVQTRNELQAKDERIKELEDQLEVSGTKGNNVSNREVNELKNALKREVDKNQKLTEASNTQKQTIEKLTRQISSLKDFLRKQ